jgi:5,10-methylenetetrahydrofolate reductase
LRLGERVSRGLFTTLIEVFPPNFSAETAREPLIGIKQKMRDMIARVRRIEDLADAILVTDQKDPSRLQLASVYTSAVLKDELGTEVIPVVPMRDMNRKAVRTTFLTCLSLGLESVSLVWGDRYGNGDGFRNVYDFRSLAEALSEVRGLAERSDVSATLLAPVDISALGGKRGARMAADRLSSGADVLLAQPPTSDVAYTLEKHMERLSANHLEHRVLPNIFPFRSREDIVACRERFGWDLPRALETIAEEGEPGLLREARAVAEAAKERGLPGIYVSTRGKPELARYILD